MSIFDHIYIFSKSIDIAYLYILAHVYLGSHSCVDQVSMVASMMQTVILQMLGDPVIALTEPYEDFG